MAIADPPATTPALDVPLGFWQREDSHNPRPLTPLGASIFVDGLNRSFAKVFAEFGLILDTLAYRLIGGYVYTSAVPLGAKAGDKPRSLPPAPMLWLALRTVPMFRRRLARCKEAMRTRADVKLVDRWFDEWRPKLIADIARLRALDLTSMTDDELSTHVAEIREWTYDAFDVHFFLTAPYTFALAKLSFFCRDYLGYDDLQVTRLLSGLSEASSEPAIALAALADRIRADVPLRDAVLAAQPRDAPDLVRKRGGEVAAAYDDYVHRYAFRALRYEVVEKTMGEEPELVARLLQDQLRHPADVRTEQDQLARERRAAFEAAERFAPPPAYGVEPPLPPFWVLPPEAREAMQAMQFAREKIFELETAGEQRDTSNPREVHGRAAARGTYSGPVRVIMGEHEFDKIQSGDVLVCPITSPVWSVLFAKVGALVTDSGGILSHPAIIAREYGIPAVVATRTATTRLRDDQRVTVDGNTGIVRVID